MVTLVVSDYEQVSMLENMLIQANIDYMIDTEDTKVGIRTPYLVVNGVPMDESKALKWIQRG